MYQREGKYMDQYDWNKENANKQCCFGGACEYDTFFPDNVTSRWFMEYQVWLLTYKEDHGVQPVVSEDEGYNKEWDPQKDSYSGDYVDEMVDFLGYGRFAWIQTRGQACDTAHNCVIPTADDYTFRRSWNQMHIHTVWSFMTAFM